eukprot:TRINITY_DN11895_c0_g1_i7.p1 TRINITY_DN11895_c0_g1~~TRINITY_DN11895_c0_g1_i7.p1  ORF type:complete len:180 (+),score=46.69 TRINITY_DN11895_c0_g1_i7:122-661(+)
MKVLVVALIVAAVFSQGVENCEPKIRALFQEWQWVDKLIRDGQDFQDYKLKNLKANFLSAFEDCNPYLVKAIKNQNSAQAARSCMMTLRIFRQDIESFYRPQASPISQSKIMSRTASNAVLGCFLAFSRYFKTDQSKNCVKAANRFESLAQDGHRNYREWSSILDLSKEVLVKCNVSQE